MEAIISGYITIKSFGRLKTKTLTNCWCILYSPKGNTPPHINVYEDQNKTDPVQCKKSLDLIEAKWAKVDSFEPALSFTVKNKRYLFVYKTEQERSTWFQHLLCVSANLFASHQSLISSGKGGICEDDPVIMQDNCLYASTNDVCFFKVLADQNGSCSTFGFKGMLKLGVSPKSVQLYEDDSLHLLAEWAYTSIRAYGSSTHRLDITAGKKSSTGEGVFSFMTVEGAKIVLLIGLYAKRLRDMELGKAPQDCTTVETLPNEKRLDSVSSSSSPSGKKKKAPGIPSPKPVSPKLDPTTWAKGNVFDAHFKNELSQTIGTGVPQGERKKSLEPVKSNTSRRSSNESLSKKDSKKAQKEKEKMAKQSEKESKKLAKEKEKQEKERQKQLDKLKKSETKGKPQSPIAQKEIPAVDELVYSSVPEDDYAQCGPPTVNSPPPPYVDSQIYSDPWGPLPIPPFPPDDMTEDTYENDASLDMGKNGKKVIPKMAEHYEDVGYSDVHVNAYDMDESNNNVYDHFVNTVADSSESPENIYGMDSAKSLTNNIYGNFQN